MGLTGIVDVVINGKLVIDLQVVQLQLSSLFGGVILQTHFTPSRRPWARHCWKMRRASPMAATHTADDEGDHRQSRRDLQHGAHARAQPCK